MRHLAALVGLGALLSTLAPGEGRAQSRGGFYLRQGLGTNSSSALELSGSAANTPGSICDEHLNPFTDLMPAFCGDPDAPQTAWTNAFDGASGILAGGALGYRFPGSERLRVEIEYFYRESVYNQTSGIESSGGVAVAKLDGEVVAADDRIGSATSRNLFGNLYYDFTNRSRATPWIGLGVGVGFTNLDHGLSWVRNDDPALITSISRYFPEDRHDDLRTVQQNLASTTSTNQTELESRLLGYQVLVGVDFALNDSVSLGVAGRRTASESFRDTTGPIDRLRSHTPASNRLDGSNPVTVTLETNERTLYGFGLHLKYRF